MTFRAPSTFICRASLLGRRGSKERKEGKEEGGGGRRGGGRKRRQEKKREEEEADVYSVTSGVQEQRPVVLAAVQAEFNNNAIYTASIKLHTPYSLIHSH